MTKKCGGGNKGLGNNEGCKKENRTRWKNWEIITDKIQMKSMNHPNIFIPRAGGRENKQRWSEKHWCRNGEGGLAPPPPETRTSQYSALVAPATGNREAQITQPIRGVKPAPHNLTGS